VLGTSGGGPYALACAKELSPEKFKGVGVVAGMSPVSLGLDGMGFGSKFSIYFTQWMPSLGRKIYDWAIIPAAQNEDPAVFRKQVTDGFAALGEKDRALLEDTELSDLLVNASREHFRQGNQGLDDEWRIFVTDWGFELKSITLKNVRLWCGTEDSICPPELSRKIKDGISQAKLTEFEGDTHYSIFAEKGEQILRELLES
jgi:pimeloyl-ACP methyl ester carboxylesterase